MSVKQTKDEKTKGSADPESPQDTTTLDETTPEKEAELAAREGLVKEISQAVTQEVTKNMAALFQPPKIDSENVDPKDQLISNLTDKILSALIPKEKLDSLSHDEKITFAKHPDLLTKKNDSVVPAPGADYIPPNINDGSNSTSEIFGTKYTPEQLAMYGFADVKDQQLPFKITAIGKTEPKKGAKKK